MAWYDSITSYASKSYDTLSSKVSDYFGSGKADAAINSGMDALFTTGVQALAAKVGAKKPSIKTAASAQNAGSSYNSYLIIAGVVLVALWIFLRVRR